MSCTAKRCQVVLKELTVLARAYHLVRLGLGHSARLPHVGAERISVLEALRWLGAPGPGIP